MPGHRTKGFCASALALALCAVLAGCGGSGESAGGGKVVLRYTWWGNPDRAARTDQAVALFEKRRPDIEARTSFSDYNAYKQKLAVQATGGDAPDVMQLDHRQIDQYASGGVLLDLARGKTVLRTSEIDPGSWTPPASPRSARCSRCWSSPCCRSCCSSSPSSGSRWRAWPVRG